VKLNGTEQLEGSVTVYQAGYQEFRGELIQERAESGRLG
jgi:hypothetical protein